MEMATKNDNNSFAPYQSNEKVEELIAHVQKKSDIEKYSKLVDEGLDTRLFETNPEEFQRIVDSYKEAMNR